jgi:cell division protein FtsL
MMTRLNVLLLVALVLSAMYLVKTSYESRRLFAELDKLQNEQRRLDVDHQRLLTERQAEATNLRVERVAREKLQMRPATPAVTQYVTDSGGAK